MEARRVGYLKASVWLPLWWDVSTMWHAAGASTRYEARYEASLRSTQIMNGLVSSSNGAYE